ncbi:MAG: MBL fold metallo-hydrolase [Eubacterium sp.]|nr:MBL fold metallo-hydrolase [Eubacterium sp.]
MFDVAKIIMNEQNSIRIDAEKKIYIDPYHIEDEPHDADYIFLTHAHYDHFSKESIVKIVKSDTQFVFPKNMGLQFKTTIGKDYKFMKVVPDESYETDDFAFETVKAYNPMKPFHPKMLKNVGYILKLEDTRIYIAGDTDLTQDAKNVKCDIALIPIGGFYTMDYKEAAELINVIKPAYAIPTHYGTAVGKKSDGDDFKKLVGAPTQVVLKLFV